MVKSRAEIQKAYRQRIKERDNEQYLAKERLRRRSTYVPSGQLSRQARTKRNKQNRDYLRVYRHKKKVAAEAQINNNVADNEEGATSSGYETASSVNVAQPDGPRRLVIRMGFPARARGSRVRMRNTLNEYKQKMNTWKEKYESLHKKYKSKLRAMQRSRKSEQSQLTPRSMTRKQIQNLGLNADQTKSVKKQLLFSNVLCEEVKSARKQAKKHQKSVLHGLVGGKILKKYRCIQMAGKRTGLSRNKLGRKLSKGISVETLTRRREIRNNRDKVICFMEREDNSRMMPGKRDCKKDNNEKKQTRVLTDYLSNLHTKFLSENPSTKLSLASFCRIRPKYILLASFISRSTCLCVRHQNMSLLLKTARNENVKVSINGDKVLETKEEFLEDLKEKMTSDEITLSQWKRVTVEEKGKQKMVMRVVDQKMKKQEFIDHAKNQIDEFASHVTRVKTQYEEIRRLKDNLPENNVIVQMDFAENWACKSLNEIQSAYWNMTNVTLHPFVVYYRQTGTGQQLQHKSYVIVSDELAHSSNTVLTFLCGIMKEVKLICPLVSCVHYWTDSPTSQYRNKFIFFEVANHKQIHGTDSKWNYFESGHGKGPCDGLGGVTKRMADDAVNTGKATIQSAQDFFAWTQSETCSLSNVKFVFISKEECDAKAVELNKRDVKAVSGTMKVHAVAGLGRSEVQVRDTSCYCNMCLSDEFTCASWRRETVEKRNRPETNDPRDESLADRDEAYEATSEQVAKHFEVDQYVAAKYAKQWYVGKITDVDEDDMEVEISFMERKKHFYQWPRRPDVIWVKYSDVVKTISAPIPTGKSKRLYKLVENDKDEVNMLFNQECLVE